MKKADFKKMAMLGITVGLSVAATSSACCGKGKQESDNSSDLLSSLNKASEGFYLAHGGCAPGKCGVEGGSKGTNSGQGNISMAEDAQPSTLMQGDDAELQDVQKQQAKPQNGRAQDPNQTRSNNRTSNGCAPAPRPNGMNSTSNGCAPAPRPNGMNS